MYEYLEIINKTNALKKFKLAYIDSMRDFIVIIP
jgi:hypothetical protein